MRTEGKKMDKDGDRDGMMQNMEKMMGQGMKKMEMGDKMTDGKDDLLSLMGGTAGI